MMNEDEHSPFVLPSPADGAETPPTKKSRKGNGNDTAPQQCVCLQCSTHDGRCAETFVPDSTLCYEGEHGLLGWDTMCKRCRCAIIGVIFKLHLTPVPDGIEGDALATVGIAPFL
jgi:hypothetical protein